ncbi:MAG: DUF1013 domain-containing protein [Rhizobiaceae bacterium]|nr:DUF1013 domain-containing protein [Rhizobiaceae bacterium]
MAQQLLMPKATAVWLVDNTSLSFEQVADFCTLHPLEVKAIADGESAQGIKGMDPIMTGQLTREEIDKGEKDEKHRLKLSLPKVRVPEAKRKGPRYTPVSKRQDRPNAILWLVRNHPELKDPAISRLVGTTKNTIAQIRDRQHWNSANLAPMDPVTLGLCSQIDLDMEIEKASRGLPPRHEDYEEEERLLSAAQTQNYRGREAAPAAEDGELDAAAVFAKLTSMKRTQAEVDADEDEPG